MAELDEFEKHLLRSGITPESKDGALADLPPLVARREDARQSVVEAQGPRLVEARRNDGDPGKSETEKLGSVRRADFAAIEAKLKHARQEAAKAEPLGTATLNVIPSLADELKSRRHGAETAVSDPVGVTEERASSRPSRYVMAGIIMAGLAGLGLGNAFWNDASNPSDVSSITPAARLAKPPSQAATSADIPAQQATALELVGQPTASNVRWRRRATVASAGGNAVGCRGARRNWAREPDGWRSGVASSNPNAGRASRNSGFARA